jgi:hypothetical protein
MIRGFFVLTAICHDPIIIHFLTVKSLIDINPLEILLWVSGPLRATLCTACICVMDVPFRCPVRDADVLALRFQHSKGTMPRWSNTWRLNHHKSDNSERNNFWWFWMVLNYTTMAFNSNLWAFKQIRVFWPVKIRISYGYGCKLDAKTWDSWVHFQGTRFH